MLYNCNNAFGYSERKDQDNSTTFREVTLWSTSNPRDRRTVTHGDLVLIHASHSAS